MTIKQVESNEWKKVMLNFTKEELEIDVQYIEEAIKLTETALLDDIEEYRQEILRDLVLKDQKKVQDWINSKDE